MKLPFVASLALLAVLGAAQNGPVRPPVAPPAKPPVAPPKEAEETKLSDVEQRQSTELRGLLAGLYGDLLVARSRWDAAWAMGVRQTPKTALQNLADCSREFMTVTQRRVDLDARLSVLPKEVMTLEDRAAIVEGLRSLERIARARDDADYEYRVAPTEGGPTAEAAQKTWREQRDRLLQGLRETEARLRRPEWPKGSFDEAVAPLAWAVVILDRFQALPDPDLSLPSIVVARTGSALLGGDRITGIRHVGDAEFTPTETWAAAKAFVLANAEKPGGYELRIVRGGAEQVVGEPAAKPAA